MKKLLLSLLLISLLLTFLSSCQGGEDPSTDKVFPSPFPDSAHKVDAPLGDEEIKAIFSDIPGDRYVEYQSLHGSPISATLYKNGESISLDVNDPRILKLVNLYNNSVYYKQYAYKNISEYFFRERVLCR